MERAGRSLAKFALSPAISKEELACAAWPVAVGKRISSHARAASVVRERLVVEVEDEIWRKQLFHLSAQLLAKLREVVGPDVVTDLEFRLAAPRRPAQSSPTIDSAQPLADDADGIQDSSLRMVYKRARKRASA